MIIVSTYKDSQGKIIADYGIDTDTDYLVNLPQVEVHFTGALYDIEIGEWIL